VIIANRCPEGVDDIGEVFEGVGDALLRDTIRGVAGVGLDDGREFHPGVVGAVAGRDETGVRHRDSHLFRDAAHEGFVVAERKRLRP